jgi:hypothetical protein
MLIQRQIAQGFTGHLIIFALCGTLMTATCLGQDRVSHDAAVTYRAEDGAGAVVAQR